MLTNNRFSTKNTKLYKMKCLNTRNCEYKDLNTKFDVKVEKYTDKNKK